MLIIKSTKKKISLHMYNEGVLYFYNFFFFPTLCSISNCSHEKQFYFGSNGAWLPHPVAASWRTIALAFLIKNKNCIKILFLRCKFFFWGPIRSIKDRNVVYMGLMYIWDRLKTQKMNCFIVDLLRI